MRGGEAFSPAAREKEARGKSVFQGWSLALSCEHGRFSGVCCSPNSSFSLWKCISGICHIVNQVPLAVGASLIKTGKEKILRHSAWGQVFPRAPRGMKPLGFGMLRNSFASTDAATLTLAAVPHCTRLILLFERKKQRFCRDRKHRR